MLLYYYLEVLENVHILVDWQMNNECTSPQSMFLLLSHSVVSDSLQPYGLQHTRLPFLSQSPGVCSNSCPLSW